MARRFLNGIDAVLDAAKVLVDRSVTNVKLASDLDASKLTQGTLPTARFPAAALASDFRFHYFERGDSFAFGPGWTNVLNNGGVVLPRAGFIVLHAHDVISNPHGAWYLWQTRCYVAGHGFSPAADGRGHRDGVHNSSLTTFGVWSLGAGTYTVGMDSYCEGQYHNHYRSHLHCLVIPRG